MFVLHFWTCMHTFFRLLCEFVAFFDLHAWLFILGPACISLAYFSYSHVSQYWMPACMSLSYLDLHVYLIFGPAGPAYMSFLFWTCMHVFIFRLHAGPSFFWVFSFFWGLSFLDLHVCLSFFGLACMSHLFPAFFAHFSQLSLEFFRFYAHVKPQQNKNGIMYGCRTRKAAQNLIKRHNTQGSFLPLIQQTPKLLWTWPSIDDDAQIQFC